MPNQKPDINSFVLCDSRSKSRVKGITSENPAWGGFWKALRNMFWSFFWWLTQRKLTKFDTKTRLYIFWVARKNNSLFGTRLLRKPQRATPSSTQKNKVTRSSLLLFITKIFEHENHTRIIISQLTFRRVSRPMQITKTKALISFKCYSLPRAYVGPMYLGSHTPFLL